MMPKFTVLLLSGGLDSVTLLYDLHGQEVKVHAVLVDYKQPHVQELAWAKHHCHRLGVIFTTIELPRLGGLTDSDWVVPNRNMILIALAVNVAVRAKADSVAIGCNADDAAMFPDCRPEFIVNINATLAATGTAVEVVAPYIAKRKWEIGAIAQHIGVPMNESWSCYRGGVSPCGRCPACVQRNATIARLVVA